jgi:hypothetical protein
LSFGGEIADPFAARAFNEGEHCKEPFLEGVLGRTGIRDIAGQILTPSAPRASDAARCFGRRRSFGRLRRTI